MRRVRPFVLSCAIGFPPPLMLPDVGPGAIFDRQELCWSLCPAHPPPRIGRSSSRTAFPQLGGEARDNARDPGRDRRIVLGRGFGPCRRSGGRSRNRHRVACEEHRLPRSPPCVADPRAGTSEDHSGEDRRRISEGLDELKGRLATLRTAGKTGRDHLADAEVFAKGITWAFRHDTTLSPADLTLLAEALERGRNRVAALEAGKQPWAEKTGRSSAASSPRWTARCSPTA